MCVERSELDVKKLVFITFSALMLSGCALVDTKTLVPKLAFEAFGDMTEGFYQFLQKCY